MQFCSSLIAERSPIRIMCSVAGRPYDDGSLNPWRDNVLSTRKTRPWATQRPTSVLSMRHQCTSHRSIGRQRRIPTCAKRRIHALYVRQANESEAGRSHDRKANDHVDGRGLHRSSRFSLRLLSSGSLTPLRLRCIRQPSFQTCVSSASGTP